MTFLWFLCGYVSVLIVLPPWITSEALASCGIIALPFRVGRAKELGGAVLSGGRWWQAELPSHPHPIWTSVPQIRESKFYRKEAAHVR